MDRVCAHHPDQQATYHCAKFNEDLCPECIRCQDESGYCRHRSACLIWELARHGMPDDAEVAPNRVGSQTDDRVTITIQPGDKRVEVAPGTTLLDAAREAGLYVNARCGGKGVCGTCKVRVLSGEVQREESILLQEKDMRDDLVLACTARVVGPASIRLPDANEARALKIVTDGRDVGERLLAGWKRQALAEVVSLDLPPPTLENPVSDLDRLLTGLRAVRPDLAEASMGLDVLRLLGAVLRQNDWKVDVALVQRGPGWEVVDVLPRDPARGAFGLAVDLGTTSVVVHLVDLQSGQVRATTSTQNEQAVCGEDLISRIICAAGKDGLEKLHGYASRTINGLIEELLTVTGVRRDALLAVSLAGNTVMVQSLLKLDPASIRSEPYVPVSIRFPTLPADEIGLAVHPRAAVYVVPGNAAYVGGDITAGIVSSGMHREEAISLFIDVGTNGEMVLGNRDFLMTAACSAGPAFEGGGIRHGMRAMPGAIDHVAIDAVTQALTIRTVDDLPPRGICGSGMISLIGALFQTGWLDSAGHLQTDPPNPRVRVGDFGPEFVLAWADEAGIDEDVILSEVDISTLLRSKAAIYGGLKTLLNQAGLPLDAVERIRLAGGFGKFIDFDMAVTLGLLPDVPRETFEYLGNSSLAGATLGLLSDQARAELDRVSAAMTYVDFSSSNGFFDEYQQAMFLPHTEARDFPTVTQGLRRPAAAERSADPGGVGTPADPHRPEMREGGP